MKKLKTNRITIANLTQEEMERLKGGETELTVCCTKPTMGCCITPECPNL